MKKFVAIILVALIVATTFAGCDENGTYADAYNTQLTAADLQKNQPTPTDINYSLERYNLIRRAYWVNGQREKANTLPCPVVKPLGYIVLFTEGGGVVGRFIVDGKVSSLNSYLTPDTKTYPDGNWLADVDGSYGENDSGIFFFDVNGNYIEWTGIYLYSDIPFEVDDPIVKMEVAE